MANDTATRQYGYGSIYRRSSDGLWVASAELPRKRGEPRKRMIFSSKSRALVELRLAAWRVDNPAPKYLGIARTELMDLAKSRGTHTEGEWWKLVRATRGNCQYCGKRCFFDLEMDHIIPVARGGSDAIENITVACTACNAEKSTMTGDEYRDYRAGKIERVRA